VRYATRHRASVTKKIVVTWKKINFKVSHVKYSICSTWFGLTLSFANFVLELWNFFCALACWYTSFQIVVHKNWRKLSFIEFKITTVWRTCKWCWFSQYLNSFLELRAWDSISHSKESIGCNMDHCCILMSLHLKYLLNWAICSIFMSQPHNVFLISIFLSKD